MSENQVSTLSLSKLTFAGSIDQLRARRPSKGKGLSDSTSSFRLVDLFDTRRRITSPVSFQKTLSSGQGPCRHQFAESVLET